MIITTRIFLSYVENQALILSECIHKKKYLNCVWGI